jgi:hypothetical protein
VKEKCKRFVFKKGFEKLFKKDLKNRKTNPKPFPSPSGPRGPLPPSFFFFPHPTLLGPLLPRRPTSPFPLSRTHRQVSPPVGAVPYLRRSHPLPWSSATTARLPGLHARSLSCAPSPPHRATFNAHRCTHAPSRLPSRHRRTEPPPGINGGHRRNPPHRLSHLLPFTLRPI